MNTDWDLADRLRKAMRHSGLNSAAIAEELEISRNTVSGWIAGRHRPRGRDLRAFARVTGYDPAWLEYGDQGIIAA